ncbi:MAG: D-alanyl-D-alanine carboxypeptidase/D-alanyl-D-alanine-endopeptidase [Actinomycetota bacterium]
MELRTRFRILAVAVAVLVSVLAVPTAVAAPTTVDLASSAGTMRFGGAVTLSGTVIGDPGCTAGRTIELRWQVAGGTGFAPVAQGTTASDGSFTFDRSPEHSGRFRAFLPQADGCTEATSGDAPVRVKVLVAASTSGGASEAGSCVDVFTSVSPAKPGQTVELQRRSGGAWVTTETVPLNGDGEGRAEPCLGWDDVGTLRLRFRWPAQDALNEASASAPIALEVTRASWMRRIEDVVGGRGVSVAVAEEGVSLFERADETPRTPASNEKLLLAMALLDTFGAEHRIPTLAAARAFQDGVVRGDLWVLGRGDPSLGPAAFGALADELVAAGVERVTGSVNGSTTFFRRDWGAPGWNDVARDYVNRPTALTFAGNRDANPEREAATALTKQLELRGVRVTGRPGAGAPPSGLETLASIDSKPMRVLLTRMLRPSWNFGAEVLGKGLGVEARGAPGTIAKGAATIEAWTAARGASFSLFDNSGLSYDNRVTAAGIVGLLTQAEDEDWGAALRRALPTGGQGTLEDRLFDVEIRAKTGTLTDVSALSGWIFAERRGAWIEFSILCAGMSKSVASDLEDRIVRILETEAG